MPFRPLEYENQTYRHLFESLSQRLSDRPGGAFNIEDLFLRAEWLSIGTGLERQHFGKRFASCVEGGQFPTVARNGENPGGNEAIYLHAPPLD